MGQNRADGHTQPVCAGRSEETSIYWHLKQRLEDVLASLEAGDPLPGERSLAESMGVSRTTLRRVLSEFAAAGRLERVQGRGSFVVKPQRSGQIPISIGSYTEHFRKLGRRPSSRMLEMTTVPADVATAARLAVAPGAMLWLMRRLRLVDDKPVSIESAYVPVSRCPDLRQRFTAADSLYEVLRKDYGIDAGCVEKSVETILPCPSDAELLGAQARHPMLLMCVRSFDMAGKPFEWASALFRGDEYRIIGAVDGHGVRWLT
ncbi:GntR family transcriptional regulator [Amycolatopsis sp. FU40]|uniref:GntR family transcriptional regulator n=1 Tax=Amycolatopsis sp. FU40 TaxID=2914159 RepID=UPI001F4871D2|nr:GntR family transcriptional regulator [Amycolatopsis sp. FU40]UKD51079.1 GntR family transcriptional regulator [Amycolatopsis sp. FU40]